MKHVFLSYAREDGTFVDALQKSLENHGHTIWRDIKDLPAGARFSEEIKNAIDNAYAIIFIISEASQSSDWVESELNYALDKGKSKVIPIRLFEADLPLAIQNRNYLHYSPDQSRDRYALVLEYQELVAKVIASLSEIEPMLKWTHALKSELVQERETAARKLGKIRDQDTVPVLVETLSDPDPNVRFEAAIALGMIRHKSAYKPLQSLIKREKDPDVIAATADALGEIGRKCNIMQASQLFIKLLSHEDRIVRESCALALGKYKEKKAVDLLIRIMRNDTISNVRESAITALKCIGSSEALRAVRRIERDTNYYLGTNPPG